MEEINPNYDIAGRKSIEDLVLGTLINFDKNMKMKEVFFKHGIDSVNCFYHQINKDIFYTALDCWKQNMSVDLYTIVNNRPKKYRDANNINDCKLFDMYCINYTNKVASQAHLEHHLFLLKQFMIMDFWNEKAIEIKESNWDNRDVIQVSTNIIDGYNILFEKITENLKQNSSTEEIKETARQKFERAKKGEVIGVPTGIDCVDNHMEGWMPSEFSIVAGRPGMGKTTVSLSSAYNSTFKKGKKGVFFSLEMTKTQLMNRIIAQETGMNYQDIKNFKITDEQFEEVLRWYDFFDSDKCNLIIVDDMDRLNEIVNFINSNDIEFAMIDYLQLIKLSGEIKSRAGNREQEVSEVSKTLKATAKKNDIPVIALSQLSRAVEKRDNKRPMLSDLRESGSIEQDADNVFFVYREAYYTEKKNQVVPEIEKGNLEFILAKYREGSTDNFRIHLDFVTYELSDGFKYNGGSQPNVPTVDNSTPNFQNLS